MPAFKIASRWVGDGHPAFIIAEISTNHMGQPEVAHQMIDTAAFCGADVVRFQKRNVDRILTCEGLNAPYTGRHSFGSIYGEGAVREIADLILSKCERANDESS